MHGRNTFVHGATIGPLCYTGVDASAYMLGRDMGVVDRQASGLQHVGALHLSMHGSCPTGKPPSPLKGEH